MKLQNQLDQNQLMHVQSKNKNLARQMENENGSIEKKNIIKDGLNRLILLLRQEKLVHGMMTQMIKENVHMYINHHLIIIQQIVMLVHQLHEDV
jgi:hypothetical protein